ncbi:MAG TPA: hypothetical protein PLO50_15330 [Nitrospira sp.]|nr:hypothetical protein [Nitrospira sp.]
MTGLRDEITFSDPERSSNPVPHDPIITARVEAIKQLAGGLSDRVAVMDQSFNVVYANEAAWSVQEKAPVRRPHAKCYEAFAQRTDPCGTCPAIKVFEASDVQCVSCSGGGDGTACGMQQAFPLTDAQGSVTSMLVLFQPTSKPVHIATAGDNESTLPAEGLGDLIGRSMIMQELFYMTRLVAESSATVLI